MNPVQEMQARIRQLEEELGNKNQELNAVRSEYSARLTNLESKMAQMIASQANMSSNAGNAHNRQKILVDKPEVFKGESNESLDSFIGRMELYLAQIPEELKLKVAVSYLSGSAFEYFNVANSVDQIVDWPSLKDRLKSQYQSVNKRKIARDKLARWKQLPSVVVYIESFMKIILDIPGISKEEVIDRYMRRLKQSILKELCTIDYDCLTTLMSHTVRVEASKTSF